MKNNIVETKLLEEIGLTRSEALVYVALAELGPSSTGKIVQKSGVASSKIYELLEKLELKGLVSHVIESGVKIFEPASPERIIDYIIEKQKYLDNEKIKAERFVTLLKSKISLAKHEQEATIYRGIKGLKTVFYESIKTMKPRSIVYIVGVPSRSEKVNRFFVRWNKFRAKNRIKCYIMFNEAARGEQQTIQKNNPLSKVKFLTENVLMPAAINIFDDKIIIFPTESGEEPLLILIRSKEIAESFTAQFKLLWNLFKSRKIKNN